MRDSQSMKRRTPVRYWTGGSLTLLAMLFLSPGGQTAEWRTEVAVWNFVDFWPSRGVLVPTNSHLFVICRGCTEEFVNAIDSGSPFVASTSERIPLIKLHTFENAGDERPSISQQRHPTTVFEFMPGWDMRRNTSYRFDFKDWIPVLQERKGQLTYDWATGEKVDHDPPTISETHDFGLTELPPGDECRIGGIKGLFQIVSQDQSQLAAVIIVRKGRSDIHQHFLPDVSAFVYVLECARMQKSGPDWAKTIEISVDLLDVAGNPARNVVKAAVTAKTKSER